MSKFDTHGGYFAPKDYMKVESGGSHEENPNGGVQIGVDQEGTPNLLEEGEPVYKDYVYSDNIKASERFLKDNNIPERYAGQLYSKIADSFFSEAENRPYDPISRNGLEAMLGRLADAQEGQKAYNEQRKLERELKSLSPDEFAALEQMLADGEQQMAPAEQAQPEAYPEPVPAEMPMEQVPVEQPMMGCGGRIKKFDVGGPLTPEEEAMMRQSMREFQRENYPDAADNYAKRFHRATDVMGFAPGVPGLVAMGVNALSGDEVTDAIVNSNGEIAGISLFRPSAKRVARNAGAKVEYDAAKKEAAEAITKGAEHVRIAREGIKTAKEAFDTAKEALEYAAANNASAETIAQLSKEYEAAAKAISGARWKTAAEVVKAVGARGKSAVTILKHPNAGRIGGGIALGGLALYSALHHPDELKVRRKEIDEEYKDTGDDGIVFDGGAFYPSEDYRNGGKINKFVLGGDRYIVDIPDGESWDYDISQVMKTPPVLDPSTVVADRPMRSYSIPELANKIYGGYSAPNLDSYRQGFSEPGVSEGVPTQPHFNASDSESYMGSLLSSDYNGIDWSKYDVDTVNNTVPEAAAPIPKKEVIGNAVPYTFLSTFPRYAGAIGSGILGLYNALQKPDEYKGTRYKPFVPSGRINLQNQVYNPVDQNMLMNQTLAQGNSTMRGLRNSGLGPSTVAAMIAQDNNITGNLGNTFLQTWDANNQRRNAIIAANNQNEAQRAQFDANIDYYRQRALAEAQVRNAQQDLMLQGYNYGAEGDKYTAVSNQISNALKAISGIGQENYVMNQINANPYNEGYAIFNNGNITYVPGLYRNQDNKNTANTGKCGGTIKRKKR